MTSINFSSLFKHVFISGFIVGTFAYLAENKKHKLGGFLYGSLPLGFLYILLMSKMNYEQQTKFSEASLLGAFFFITYIGILYFLLKNEKFNLFMNLLITTIIFMTLLFIMNRYIYKFTN